jgi:hypothetical protein
MMRVFRTLRPPRARHESFKWAVVSIYPSRLHLEPGSAQRSMWTEATHFF